MTFLKQNKSSANDTMVQTSIDLQDIYSANRDANHLRALIPSPLVIVSKSRLMHDLIVKQKKKKTSRRREYR